MGYTISAEAKDKTLKDDLLQFLNENYRTWSELAHEHNLFGPKAEYNDYATIPMDGEMDYDDNPDNMRIGISYGVLDDAERFYVYSIIKWIAVQFGSKHYYYDGNEIITIDDEVLKNKGIDPTSIDKYMMHCSRPTRNMLQKARPIVINEIERLDAMWNKLNFDEEQ